MQNLEIELYKDGEGRWAIQLFDTTTNKSFIYNIVECDSADIEAQVAAGLFVRTSPDSKFESYTFAPHAFANAPLSA